MRRQSGLGLIEVLAALALLGVAILGALIFQTRTLQRLNEQKRRFRAELKLRNWSATELSEGRCLQVELEHGLALIECQEQGDSGQVSKIVFCLKPQ